MIFLFDFYYLPLRSDPFYFGNIESWPASEQSYLKISLQLQKNVFLAPFPVFSNEIKIEENT